MGLIWGYIVLKRENLVSIITKTKVIELYNYMKSKGANDEILNLHGETAKLFYQEI
jgi:hypothetical protein